ncbi:MAG: LVIVD repeat-containing protein, partial [Candidatus Thorarchaeota archaeon]
CIKNSFSLINFKDDTFSPNSSTITSYETELVLNNITNWDENIADPFDFQIYNDYLFVIDFDEGIKVYDISNIDSPQYLTTIDDYIFPTSFAYSGGPTLDFVVVNEKLFISDYFYNLYVFDITNINNPQLLYTGETFDINTFFYLETYNGFVFASTGYNGDDCILILDPSSTTEPLVISRAILPVNAFCRNFKVYNDLIFTVDDDNTLNIIDITDIENPIIISTTILADYYYYGSFAVNEHYFVTSIRNSESLNNILVYNISDPNSPVLALNYTNELLPYILGVIDITLQNDTYYFLNSNHNLQIIDLYNLSDVQILSIYNFTNGIKLKFLSYNVIGILSGHGEIHFLNVTDSSNPQLLSFINFGDSTMDILIEDNYIYIANGYDGIYILEIVDNSSVETRCHYKDITHRFSALTLKDDLLYCCTPENSIFIFNVSTKTHIDMIATCNFKLSGYLYPEIIVEGNLAFHLNDYFSLDIIDISNPSNPKYLSTYEIENETYNFLEYIYVDVPKNHLYCFTSKHLEVVDITDPENLHLISNETILGGGCIFACYNAPILFISQKLGKISVVDFSDPFNPILLSTITSSSFLSMNYYNNYLFAVTKSPYWIRSTLVYNCTNISAPYLVGNFSYLQSSSLSFSNDFLVEAKGSLGFNLYLISTRYIPIIVTQGFSIPSSFYLIFSSILSYYILILFTKIKSKKT